MQKRVLSTGNCVMEEHNDRFTYITQDGQRFFCRYKKSEDTEFSVAWDNASRSHKEQLSTQVCLIEKEKNILWTEEFRRADSCEVSNDGTVAVKDLNLSSWTNSKGMVIPISLYSIHVISRNGQRLNLDFGEQAEVISFGLSPDGNFLAYNLQKHHPDIYQIVLHNLRENKEEWRYKYPQDQVVHELIFKGPCLLVYSGPRPSAFVDRRYSFTLDLTGRITQDDITENQKQKERDSIAASASDVADKVIQTMVNNLKDVAPTIEATKRSQVGTKLYSPAMSNIMTGRKPLPALHITITPAIHILQFQEDKLKLEEKGYPFFLHIEIVARTIEERAIIVEKCLQTLNQKEEELRKDSLAITTKPSTRIIGAYPGSGSYMRANISFMVAFPSKERTRKGATL